MTEDLNERVEFLSKRLDQLINNKVDLIKRVKELEKQLISYQQEEKKREIAKVKKLDINPQTKRRILRGLKEVKNQKFSLLTS